MIYLGPCSARVREGIQHLLVAHLCLVNEYLEPNLPYIAYSALLAHQCPRRISEADEKVLRDVCHELTRIAYGDKPVTILTAGFLEAPVNCRRQRWHYDYGGNTENLLVPLVPATERNATEYVEWLNPAMAEAMMHRILPQLSGTYELKDLEIPEPFRISRAIAAPFDIIRMPNVTLHRGTPNQEDFVRRVFYIATTLVAGFDLQASDKEPIVSWALDGAE
jgi:hypothetical protein